MQSTSFEEAVEQLLRTEKRFHREAYLFLRDSLDHTRKMLDRETKAEKARRAAAAAAGKEQHVTAQELLEGIRELALQNFGPMALTVLAEWGVHSCQDFGELVFIMVENHLLKKTEKDSRADFDDGYDFNAAFRNPFLPLAKQSKLTPPSKVTQN